MYMLAELDPFDIQLARELACTVEEMTVRISNQEYLMRRAHAVYAAAQVELQMKAARRGG